MKKLLLIIFSFCSIALFAQQNTSYREGEIQSPVVNADGTVTFIVSAPKAKTVTVQGDWEANGGTGRMTKNKKTGIWTYTTPVLPSEMYTYRIQMDGVYMLDPTNPFVRRDVGTQFSVFFVDGGAGDYYQVHKVPHGTVSQTWYRSEASGLQRRLTVYTPADYDISGEHYPVLYLLHGSGGDENAWLELGCVARIMDNLIARKKMQPTIVVMPNGNFSVEAAPGETHENLQFRPVMSNKIPGNYKNGRYEMAFKEIVDFIDRNYRTIPDREHRAVSGLSMGGFHTLFIALNHPDLFSYVGLMSAGLGNQYLDEKTPAYADYKGKLQAFMDSKPALFWIAIGRDDFLYDVNTDFRKQLDEIGFVYQYHESTRGHLWCNWRQYLLIFAQKLWQ